MRCCLAAVLWWLLGISMVTPASAQACAGPNQRLGVSRVVEIVTAGGPMFGTVTRLLREESFLRPKEVVLTFDDGPVPSITRPILDILDRFCTKATFFPVGRMAIAHPEIVREVAARGHTLGAHTWSHPSLRGMRLEAAKEEIERGFAAVAIAAGRPIAPFFRFPGLGDSEAVVAFLQSRGVSTFSVDVVSNDSFIADSERLARLTIERIEARHGGIILFHDIKAQTVRALPIVLEQLQARGYRIVHLRAKRAYEPVETYAAELRPLLAKAHANGTDASTPSLEGLGDDGGAPATEANPPAKARAQKAAEPDRVEASAAAQRQRSRKQAGSQSPAAVSGWATTVWRGRAPPETH